MPAALPDFGAPGSAAPPPLGAQLLPPPAASPAGEAVWHLPDDRGGEVPPEVLDAIRPLDREHLTMLLTNYLVSIRGAASCSPLSHLLWSCSLCSCLGVLVRMPTCLPDARVLRSSSLLCGIASEQSALMTVSVSSTAGKFKPIIFARMELDLHRVFWEVQNRGGYNAVCRAKLWKVRMCCCAVTRSSWQSCSILLVCLWDWLYRCRACHMKHYLSTQSNITLFSSFLEIEYKWI